MPSALSNLSARLAFRLLLTALLVALGDAMFYQFELHGGHFGLFALALLAALWLGRPALWRDTRALVALAFALIYALALIRDPGPLRWSLFWCAAAMASLLPLTARFGNGASWFARLAWLGLQAPFAPLIDAGRIIRTRQRHPLRWNFHAALPHLVLPVLGSAAFLFLFATANPVLGRFFAGLQLTQLRGPGLVRVLLWMLLAMTGWALLRPRLLRWTPAPFAGADGALPGVTPRSVTLSLIAFNLVFALQNALDLLYLGGLAPMPEGLTLADYAHRGAYPLIATALLAALFVLVTLRPGSETAQVPLVRRLVVVWIAQNIVLVLSSIVRTLDYIDAYLLTGLRIAALAWMALVGFGLAAICWRLLKARSAAWLVNVNLAATLVVLTLASFLDTGALAAWWDVRHAREVGGNAVRLDLCYLNRLGPSALLPLLELEGRKGLTPRFRERVRAVRSGTLRELEFDQSHGGWSLVDQSRLRQARAILATRAPAPPPKGPRMCDGSRYIPYTPPPAPAPNPAPSPAPGPAPQPSTALTSQAGAGT